MTPTPQIGMPVWLVDVADDDTRVLQWVIVAIGKPSRRGNPVVRAEAGHGLSSAWLEIGLKGPADDEDEYTIGWLTEADAHDALARELDAQAEEARDELRDKAREARAMATRLREEGK